MRVESWIKKSKYKEKN